MSVSWTQTFTAMIVSNASSQLAHALRHILMQQSNADQAKFATIFTFLMKIPPALRAKQLLNNTTFCTESHA